MKSDETDILFAGVAIEAVPDRLFDYAVPAELRGNIHPGLKVAAPFGKQVVSGYVIECRSAPKTDAAIKTLLKIEDPVPFFSAQLIALLKWMAAYYCAPFALALKCALPAPVRGGKVSAREELIVTPKTGQSGLTARQKELYDNVARVDGGRLHALCKELKTTPETLRRLERAGWISIEKQTVRRNPLARRRVMPSTPRALTPEQQAALAIIRAEAEKKTPKPVLLFGVTGSGKTEVYLQAIADALAQGKSAIMMVPEIALTPQTVQRFAARFGEAIAVLHSALSAGERFDEWHRIRSGEAKVVIGPRSAIFAPLANPGIIIVDEEHEPSYKQDETPRYNARDAAVMRAWLEKCACILGSATPALESWANMKAGKYTLAAMPSRVENRPLPYVHLVDMRLETARAGRAQIFSQALISAMRQRLERGEQIILFLNRRGHSPTTQCPACGHTVECESCSVNLTWHQAGNCLRCHLCGSWKHLPASCPACGAPGFDHRGFGTQRIEEALAKIFPAARLVRMDADSTSRRFSHDDLLDTFRSGRADILLGTQMIAKGLDFPNVTLVGIIAADMSLHLPDFRAAERTFQLLAQVSGRAGRGERPGEVYIQTYRPDHPAVQASRKADFATFAAGDLEERQTGGYPPYSHLACLTFRGAEAALTEKTARQWEKDLAAADPALHVSPALPAPIEKRRDEYRFQLLIRAETARLIVNALARIRSARPLPKGITLAIDIDAFSLL